MQTLFSKQHAFSLKEYFETVSKIKDELRSRTMQELQISYATFYNKLRLDSWSAIEREKIQQILKEHFADLNS